MTTRPFNVAKHSGIPNPKKKKRSPAEMAALRAAEESAKDETAAAELASHLIIAGIEDSMAAADRDDEENAARPVPVDIVRAPCRTHTFASLEKKSQDEKVKKGQSLQWFP
jgi:hypothetical protein